MSGRHILQSCRPHFGFTPHQLSGVLQTRTDKSVYFVKPHGLPIVPSHIVWRVFATAPAASTGKLSSTPPPKMDLGAIKWTAAPLPQIKAATEKPASLKHFIKSSSSQALAPIGGTALTNTNNGPECSNPVPHPVYDDAIDDIPQTRDKPKKFHDRVALIGVKTLRLSFDLLAGYRGPGGAMTEQDWLNRCLFLETIAGVTGMVERMARRLRSLKQNNDWTQSLLDETENERMHQLIFMDMKQPGWLVRMSVLAVQGISFSTLSLVIMVSPKTCHRFVEFLEEEAIKTYTYLLEDMEHGHLDEWCTLTAPLIGRSYYDLPDDAKVYDMIKCIRVDEASHNDMKHVFDQKRTVHRFVGLQ
ncbi:hypothetical protein JG688_00006896 [Phytophthora aleatoria]|uniref:Alternative oxidase n=1 Tax=Phytophthora aleatoria TaxID=2496075 RepID=A0A8J5IT32_9STRA|nr:hypothetical protein JG688_00006896 [Phytophthora aleatoria]